jgi:ABC-2 type transport system ATP-binding protein
MTSVLETRELTKRFGRHEALSQCTLSIPSGHVVGLVGPNGAGKSTLMNLSVGLSRPSQGSIEVLGAVPAGGADQLARVGFVSQDHATYAGLSVGEHLKLGARMNPCWDTAVASRRVEQLGLDPRQRAGRLSGGQQAQLALTLALAKRPELLVLDEPVASLDPLARREFLEIIMESVAEQQISVILSSHLVADVERVCDYLVILVASRIVLAGEVDDILASHHRLVGPTGDATPLLANQKVIESHRLGRQTMLIVHSDGPVLDPSWVIEPLSLEDVVLAYMGQGRASDGANDAGDLS